MDVSGKLIISSFKTFILGYQLNLYSLNSWHFRQCEKKIKENALELLNTVIKLKPSSSKGVYLKSVNLSSTMSSSIKIDSSALMN